MLKFYLQEKYHFQILIYNLEKEQLILKNNAVSNTYLHRNTYSY